MTLLERLEKDFQQSLKAHDAARVSILRVLMASVKNAAIAARTTAKQSLDDDDVEAVVKQEVKKLKDAMVDFTKAARHDLVKSTEAELKILGEYLPAEMSVEELETIVMAKTKELYDQGLKEFGKIMGTVVKEVRGRADGNAVSAAVKRALEKLA